ncbi:hypothetical protein [Rhodococcus sp. NPDC057529]|uniref:hypothetical protein n=1 Tax=Rhodococcus sp. NPDC057529 TaxID=3346158 RepID=UPI0036722763
MPDIRTVLGLSADAAGRRGAQAPARTTLVQHVRGIARQAAAAYAHVNVEYWAEVSAPPPHQTRPLPQPAS